MTRKRLKKHVHRSMKRRLRGCKKIKKVLIDSPKKVINDSN